MHFKNGREAKEYDSVITKDYNGKVVTGVAFGLNPGTTSCNCSVQVMTPGGSMTLTCQTIGNLYHAEDALLALEKAIADNPNGESPKPAADGVAQATS